jgi:hypothetical protein
VEIERWVYTNKAGVVVERKAEDLTWAKIQASGGGSHTYTHAYTHMVS